MLLAQCPRLRVLATSQVPLHLRGEQEYALCPLSTPAPGRHPPLHELAGYAAVQLFVQRAQAVQPGFRLDTANMAAVSDICRRLDGLPLAIELAAPYLRLFTPAALLERLARRLALLTGGSRDLLVRQQTLRATLDWSYELLDVEARTLLARLGVFEGGATLAAIEAVCNPGRDLQVLPGVRTLLEHSLLVRLDGGEETRIGMLETVHEYACERLEARGEGATLRRAHAIYYLALTEEADTHVRGAEQATWLRRLEAERDNLRAALSWSLEAGEPEIGLRLGTALGSFWAVRGYVSEGRACLEEALSQILTGYRDDTAAAPAMDDMRAKALAVVAALAMEQGEYGRATAQYEESLRLYQRLGDRIGCATVLNGLGFVAQVEGKYERAAALHEESLAIMRTLGDRGGMARVLNNLGLIAQLQGRFEQAVALHEESMALKLALGHERGIAASLHNLGEVAFLQGNLEEAATRFAESVTRKLGIGTNEGVAVSLDGLAAVANALGQPARAARLLGAASALRSALGTPQKLAVRPLYEPTVASVRAALGEDAFATAWREGGERPIEDVIKDEPVPAAMPRGSRS
jgi:predicted ATPase/Tfp pilus assembly protein PilF